jgi:Winged helix-turn-helix DNA-binding
MRKKKKKWTDTHPLRHFHKSSVLDMLKEHLTDGLKQNEIIEKSKLSKPTVSRILQELLSEHKIFQLNNFYFPEFGDDFIFGYFFSDYINLFLTKIMENKKTISNLMDTPYNPKFIAKQPLDNSNFEFANTIGGLYMHINITIQNVFNLP